ncbi:MAG: hypothetical protein WBB43_20455 [Limnoraphis sp.]
MTAEQKQYDSCQPDPSDSKKLDRETQEKLDKFDQFIEKLVRKKNDADHNLIAFTRSRLRQVKLFGIYEELEIINIAVIRARSKILKGEKEIVNLKPWFKKIILYIIKEVYKKEKSNKARSEKLMDKTLLISDHMQLFESSSQRITDFLYEALNDLTESERCILILRETHNLSWEEVSNLLVEKKLEKPDNNLVVRVRKKGNRALNKLRSSFNKKI